MPTAPRRSSPLRSPAATTRSTRSTCRRSRSTASRWKTSRAPLRPLTEGPFRPRLRCSWPQVGGLRELRDGWLQRLGRLRRHALRPAGVRLRLHEREAGIANRRMVLRHPDGHLAVVGVRAGLVPYTVPTSARQAHKHQRVRLPSSSHKCRHNRRKCSN